MLSSSPVIIILIALSTVSCGPTKKIEQNGANETKVEWAPKLQIRFKGDAPIAGRIMGGELAAKGQFPWQAFVMMDWYFFCGGSLLSDRWVLTGAFCVSERQLVVVTLGPGGWAVGKAPDSIFVHPAYDKTTYQNDLALLKLAEPVVFTDEIAPINLPTAADSGKTYVGEFATASGYGIIGKESLPSQWLSDLRYAELKVITNFDCTFSFNNLIITDTKMCTDSSTSKSTCHSDSGGPLAQKDATGQWVLIGVTSFNPVDDCQAPNKPSVFTKVASYLPWITGYIGGSRPCIKNL